MTSNGLYKSIHRIIPSIEQSEGVGATVFRSIGGPSLKNLDPFLMLDEFLLLNGKGGFPDHPHRGFETVTFMLDGEIEHEDFCGNKGKIGPGDLQWMTAGKGIVHAEMPVPGKDVHGLQLWVNLPYSEKMNPPKYQELLDKDVPRCHHFPGVTVKVIAGECMDIKAKVSTFTPIHYLDVVMDPLASFEHKIPIGFTSFIYTIKGNALFGNEKLKQGANATLILSNEGDCIKVETLDEPAHFVLLSGKPINQPIVQYGPFVMESLDSVREAYSDYQMGQNGFENSKRWESEIGKRI